MTTNPPNPGQPRPDDDQPAPSRGVIITLAIAALILICLIRALLDWVAA